MNAANLDKKTILIVLVILLAGGLLRSYKAAHIEKVPHDDAISYLVAAGHLDNYHRMTDDLANTPRWVENQVWHGLFQPRPDPLLKSWATTINDLKQHDIHPPVYFLWLNILLRGVPDVAPWVGWLSNSLFFLLNGLLLFAIGSRLLPNRQAATIGLLIWTVAVASIKTSIIARHYELLTTICLLTVLVVIQTDRRRDLDPISILIFGTLTLIGFLTNYQYLYFGAALSCVILWLHWNQPLRVFWCGTAIGGGVLLGLWLYPALMQQSQEVRAWSGHVNWDKILFRLRNTLEEPLKYSVFATLTCLYLLATDKAKLKAIPQTLYLLTGLNFAFIALAYLGFIAPKHAMGERYLASVWPLLALMLGSIVHQYWHHRLYRYLAIILICLPSLLYLFKAEKSLPPPSKISSSSYIIADFNNRGVWPAIALKLPANKKTLVAPQSSLLESHSWQADMTMIDAQSGALISSPYLGSNSKKGQQALIKKLAATHTISSIDYPDRGLNYVELKLTE